MNLATKKTDAGETIEAFKGFDADMKCRDFQYVVGETYTCKGKVALCENGFHAVEFPLDALTYYPMGAYAKVSLAGVTDEKRNDSKRVGSKITINAKLSIVDLIKAQVEIVKEKAAGNIGAGDYGHAAATGDSGHAAATGYSGHAAATGNSGCAFVGFGGTAKAGKTGSFAIAWLDQKAKRARIVVGIPGENGIKTDTFYCVDETGTLKEAA